MASNRPDIYQRVTDDVLAFLRDNPDPGSSGTPWTTAAASQLTMNVTTKQPYNGINLVCLGIAALKYEHHAGLGATNKQWQEIVAQVRKGEKGAQCGQPEPRTGTDVGFGAVAGTSYRRRGMVGAAGIEPATPAV